MSNICLLLGLVQGIAEWVPISSKTANMVILLLLGYEASKAYTYALSFEAGSVAAAVLILRRFVIEKWRFITASVAGTALVALPIYAIVGKAINVLPLSYVLGLMGIALIVVSLLPRRSTGARRGSGTLEGFVAGLVQGLAALPGVSRSGITITTLMAMGYDVETAFKLSYAMYIPAGLGALALNYATGGAPPIPCLVAGYVAALATSMATVWVLLRLARRLGKVLTAAMGAALIAAAILLEYL